MKLDSEDLRKNYILSQITNHFNLENVQELRDLLYHEKLNEFLDDGNTMVLSANAESADSKIYLDSKPHIDNDGSQVLLFFKMKPTVINEDNLKSEVFTSSMVNSPVSTLYYTLHSVYSPLLLSDSKWSNDFDPKLQSLLSELEKGLGSIVRQGEHNYNKNDSHEIPSASILSPSDEIQYWEELSQYAKRQDLRSMGAHFHEVLEPLGREFDNLKNLQIEEAIDVLESCHAVLDDLWKVEQWNYPQKRMNHLFDIIANSMTRFIQFKISSSIDIWKDPFSKVEALLLEGVNICDEVHDLCTKLTTIYWPNYGPYQWKGGSYAPERTKKMKNRLTEILSLRKTYKQITQLLSEDERLELQTSNIFEHFEGMNPIHYNPYTDSQWRSRVQRFEEGLSPTENLVSDKLKHYLKKAHSSHAIQALQEFKRYKELIKRKSIAKNLDVERESLLSKLQEYLRKEKVNFNDGNPKVPSLKDVQSPTINNVYFIRQLHAKLEDIQRTGETMLLDLSSWKLFDEQLKQFIAELSEYQKDQFDSWVRDNTEAIEEEDGLFLKTSQQVVYFEAGKDMKVSYNPRLIGLTREVRMLNVLGFAIPHKIQLATDLAKKFSKQAQQLDQIAVFHNTIGDRIIQSQKPMMLDSAIDLANCVRDQSNMTWDNSDLIQSYINALRSKVDDFARLNNRLSSYHKKVRDIVIKLMDTDLLNDNEIWKDSLKIIRQVFNDVELLGLNNLKSWRSHWDRQLFKALEHQYQIGLEGLNDHLPEIKVELTYRQRVVQFKPSLEDIRMNYYKQLKKFLSIPRSFKGVSLEDSSIFSIMVDQNAHRFSHLFEKAEELFKKLEQVKNRFEEWVALGSIDSMEEFIQSHCHTAEDFKRNFQASKAKAQEIGRLSTKTEEKIDCILILFGPVLSEIELLNRKYWDYLSLVLQKSVVNDIDQIETFAQNAIQSLGKLPQTVEEIGECNTRHREYVRKTPEIMDLYNSADTKNHILIAWTNETMDKISKVENIWNNYSSAMDNYETSVSHQMESVKANLQTQVDNMNREIEHFKIRWNQFKPREDVIEEANKFPDRVSKGLIFIKEKEQEWNALMERKEKLQKDSGHFELNTEFPLYEEINKDLEHYKGMWALYEDFHQSKNELANEEWILFRSKMFKLEDFLNSWSDKLTGSSEVNSISIQILKEIENYNALVPVLKFVKGEIFSDIHWSEMFNLLSMPPKSIEKLTLGDFLKVNQVIIEYSNELAELNNRASGEVIIRQTLNELDIWEIESKFAFSEHLASNGEKVPLIKDWNDLLSKVGDNQVLFQSIKGSPYYERFGDRATSWEIKLADLDEVLNNLNGVQRKWIYLEPYQEQMKLKTSGFNYKEVFRKIDDDFRLIMSDAIRDNRVSSLLKISSIKSILNSTIDRLEKCQRSLNEFLEEKRSLFPRFYFIGDEDLLAILGQASKPEVIQNHLRKLFSGVHSATFSQDYGSITAINSLEGEEVTLLNAIQISNQAEVWLTLLSREIVHTLRQLLSECLFDSNNKGSSSQKGHEMDPLKYPSQVLCLSDSILFTKKTEESIRKRNLESYLRSLKEQLNSYTSVKLRGEDDAEEESSNVVLELKLKVLILEKINSISIVENLISQNVDSVDHWEWQKRLRYYHSHDDKSVSVAMADAEFEYTFEYQGNAQKLVHTPLTEKCYLTLTQAMKIGLGGNPYGPAGTGKTESVKALGGLFGRQVLVFNCDEGIDITSMGRIFIGLIKCGAWGCFDEFNRLEEQTLSAVSMLIQPIQFALKSKDRRVHLMDKEVELSLNTGIFVTMNPAGKGYGGRQKLPDNLKQLFRPVAMSKPDNELIAEITLYSEGFQDAKNLGHKLVNVFNMSEKLLSKQHHYDWGLRALKTVLKGCGSTLQRCGRLSEAEIIVSVLRLNTMSKLTFHDTNRFNGLVGDIFTNVNIKQEEDEELKGAILQSISEMGLNCNDTQVSKVIELKEQLKQRMGVVVVGPSGSGKTTILKILLRSLTKLGQKIIKHTINPKAIHRNKLLGYTDLDTREWNNGVLTKAAIQAVNEPVETTSWIVLDGDIDPEWVESLNSVLDDNRLLTLPSGWRIQFGPNVNFIFETHNLIYASPATISRLGIIFLSDDDANVKLLVSSWLRTHKTEEDQRSKSASRLIDELFFKALDWIVKKNEYLICTSLIGTVLNGLSYLTDNGALIQNRTKFGVGLIRGFGGNLNESCKEVFTKEVLSWIGESSSSLKYNTIYYNESSDRIESYLILDSESLNLGPSFSLPLIHTPEVQFTISQVKDALLRNEHFLLVGPECSGKSIILQYAFDRMKSTVVATIHCYANITPKDVVHKLSQSCISLSSSNGSKIFRPKEAEKLILYFKNLNTVKPDKYGTSMIISFLMQIYTYGGFYEEDSLEWINLEGILIVASMSPGTGWGRHALTERFTSIVRIISISLPSNEYLNHVYNSYLSEILQDFDDHKTKKLTGSMISLYEGIKKIFSSENQNHYRLTPKDLTHWCKGLSRYECKNVSDIIEAWHHEAKRIFRDRLSSSEDISKFDSALRRTLNSDWRGEKFNDEENFFISSGNSLTRISFSDLESLIKKGILTFSRENRNIQETVIIRELMDLVSKVDRVLSCSGGSLLLVGKPGVGRRTSVSIFSALRQIKLLTVRNGNLKTFKSDIKAAMQSAGLDNEETLLLLEDHNFNENPEYLDIINGLLSCGEVPGLYPDEEMEPFLPVLRTNASNEGYSKNMYSYFAKQVRNNLHIVIIMDDSNSNFKSNCENNPALLKECQVQWVSDWSEASLSIIPNKLIDIDDANLPSHFVSIHSMNPNNTPRNYISFIQAYKYIYEREKDKIILRKSKLSTGVHKLMEAKEVVEKLKEEAAIQEKELAEKQREANEALQMITDTMRNANLQKGEMEDLRVQTLEKEKNINERKKVIEIEMIEIKPLIEEAKRAVGDIKSSTLSEVRSLRAPPEVIRDILEGVLRLMGIQDTSWNSMKNFLAKRGVKDEILSFDARRISSKNRVIVENLLQQKQNSFDPKTAKRASEAAAPLASWVLANVKFSYILEKIKPLEAEQMKLHRNLKMAEDQIGELSTGLNEVDKQVAVLKERLNKFTKEAAEVEIHLDKTKETISIADGLVQGLQGEFDRWNSEVKLMEKSLDQLPHLSLIASAFVTYLTNAPEDIRKDMLESWCSALNFDKGEFDFTRFLSGEREMLEWRSQGLPSDVHSIENAISILLLSRLSTPYLIDPNYRATEWLKTYLAKTDTIEVTTQSDERFLLTLELAVRFGKTLIIQDASNISPVLYPLLRADIFGTSPYQVVKLQDKIVDYNDNFKLFLTTKNKSSDIPPDALSIVNMVNFTTTVSGLTGQLLALALQFEKPELEERKSELLKKEEEQKIEVGHLEDSLLEKLASSTGNILDNTELLRSLQETQEKSSAITSSLLEAQFLQDNLDREGNAYLTLAEFASQLYFSIKDLSKLNSMYRFSLSAYIRLYQKTLSVALYKDSGSERRIEALKRSLQDMVFKYVTRSLFNSDRVSFALHLVNKMHPELFGFLEWEEFLGINLQKGDHVTLTSLPEWIDEDQKVHVERLKNNLPQIYETLTLDDLSLWSSFAKSQHCEEDFPVHLVKKITPFQQLLVIQALRPDRLYRAMEIFVAKALKFKELVPPAIILNDIYEESISSEPILILITPGSDPSDELRELAKSHNKTLKEISMGQGQSELALIELSKYADEGQWIVLKNLHLMTYWIPELEKTLRNIKIHEDFRLWLTSESHPRFSPSLSESCLKVAYESPPGIKRNLIRTLSQWGRDKFSKNGLYSQAVFVLSWFHAIIQERRLYIPQGWCKFYEFSDGDSKSALGILDRIQESDNIKKEWNYVRGLLRDAIYGGRVDNSHDMIILNSYLETMFNTDIISVNQNMMRTKRHLATLPSLGPLTSLPSSTDPAQYWNIIHDLQDDDSPSSFGLPNNINRSYQRTASQLVESQLRALVRNSLSSQFERDKWQSELSPLLGLWKQLNKNGSHLLQMKMRHPVYVEKQDPMVSFVQFESYNGTIVLQTIHKTLSSLSKVLRGTLLIDDSISKLANSLLNRCTPYEWQNKWSGPLDPTEYMRISVRKAHKILEWKNKCENGSFFQDELDLSSLFNPDTFLGALRQWKSRLSGLSMQSLQFHVNWSQGLETEEGAVRVSGVMMEGASFDGLRLIENNHESPISSNSPSCSFTWVQKEYVTGRRDAISLPLYDNYMREKIIGHIRVPCGDDRDKWLQAGVVFFLKRE